MNCATTNGGHPRFLASPLPRFPASSLPRFLVFPFSRFLPFLFASLRPCVKFFLSGICGEYAGGRGKMPLLQGVAVSGQDAPPTGRGVNPWLSWVKNAQ